MTTKDDDWHDMTSLHAPPHLSTPQSLLVFKTIKDIFYSFKMQRPRKIDIGRHAKYNCGVMLDRVLKYVSDLFCFHCFIALNDSDVIYSAFWHSLENTDIYTFQNITWKHLANSFPIVFSCFLHHSWTQVPKVQVWQRLQLRALLLPSHPQGLGRELEAEEHDPYQSIFFHCIWTPGTPKGSEEPGSRIKRREWNTGRQRRPLVRV